ncbi:amidohydrolase [Hoeflea sp. WL0058]|uniref:Amidohydrolase n=1 Tax=Flavimaribacter sediminis TaxID=2865987 RepID=A0AAE3D401_9HYPH|nr:M20 aminoacylase family protein [Flavimaribacter sediminis]MBW8640268.1 amidohydrolase [Flavimaribacter sediminis]
MNTEIAADTERLVELRRDLHRWPEIGFNEQRTSALVAGRLSELGWTVTTGLAGTGVVGVMQNGDGPAIGIRADMDALPMQEASGRAWASKTEGMFHGCGHDGHTTILLALAEHLASRQQFRGTVVLIFQPAEEGLGGGRVMVEEGLFDRFPCGAVYGFHNMPLLPLGKAVVKAGPSMASQDEFKVTFRGKGGHAAMPHMSRDAVLATAEATMALQGLISRETDPHAAAVLSVTEIHSGTTHNVIPEDGWLGGTVRTLDQAVRKSLEEGLRRVCSGVAGARNVNAEIDYHHGYPVLVNDPACAENLRQAVNKALGPDTLDDAFQPLLAAEDFAYMLNERPGAYVLLGQRDDEHTAMVHNPAYDFNDRLIPIATQVLAALVED